MFAALVHGRWGVYAARSIDTVAWSLPQRLLEATLPSEAAGQGAPFPLRIGEELFLLW